MRKELPFPFHRSKILASLFFVGLVLSFCSVFSQGPPLKPSVATYPPSDYEGHPQVFCSETDAEGGAWFGMHGCVAYHNGEDWEKFSTPASVAVTDIDIDNKGRVWVGGLSDFGYLQITPSKAEGNGPKKAPFTPDSLPSGSDPVKTGELEYVSLTHLVPDSLNDFNIVWDVHAMGDRVLFNAFNVVFILDEEGLEVLRPEGEGDFYSSQEVNGEFWVQKKGEGLFKLKDKGKDTPYRVEKLKGSSPFGKVHVSHILNEVPGMVQKEKKEVLVITRSKGLYKYRFSDTLDKKEQERIETIGDRWRSRIKKTHTHGATPVRPEENPWEGVLVLSTATRGAMVLDSNGKPVQILDQNAGMTSNDVWEMSKGPDGSGILWSATNKGITRWMLQDPRTYAYEGDAFSGSIKDITRFHDQLILATSQGVFVRKKQKGPKRSHFKLIPGTEGQNFSLLKVQGVEGRKNALLVATGNELKKISRRNGSEGAWKLELLDEKNHKELSSLPPLFGHEWATAGGRNALSLYSRDAKGKWKERIQIKELPEGVASVQADPFEKDAGRAIWVGFLTKGAFKLELDRSVFRRSLRSDSTIAMKFGELVEAEKKGLRIFSFIRSSSDRKVIPKGSIRFFPWKEEVLMAAKQGAYRIEKAGKGNSKGKKSREKPGFKPATELGCLMAKCEGDRAEQVEKVFHFQEGKKGEIWTYAGGGVMHLIPQEKGGYEIDTLPFKGMNLGTVRAFYPESKDVTWIGGDNGLVRYDRTVKRDLGRTFPCYLREVSSSIQDTGRKKNDSVLFGGFYRKSDTNATLLKWERAHEQPEGFFPTLPFQMNGLTFRFAAPFYEKQSELRYSFQLQGFDEEWSEWKKETRKEYTNLPEGSYRFKVKAKNVYGVESKVAEYRFRILPPWYRTWTAYGGYTVAGIGFIWFLIWLNSRRLIAQKQRLEKIVEERTKEIREQQKETEKQKEEVEKKNQALQEANETITQQKEEVEEAHREITASIDYAQKIQHALLQSEEHESPHLPEHFILFKPQATVSGDFYWAHEQNGYLYSAAVDCTGHGVPGAFMSMLGISQLNEIMAAKELPTPGEVLTELRERVVAELSSGDPEGGAKDGMDAAMVKIPISKAQSPRLTASVGQANSKKIEFAGANNPLYVVKEGIGEAVPEVRFKEDLTDQESSDRIKPFKNSPDGFEVKGDKMAVGYEPDAAEAFMTAELEVPLGAMLYMFSDGYADQFGGSKGKKFRYGPFKELLARVHTMSPEEQKQELDRVFEEWKQGQEQIDDVCVVGIRLE